MNAMRRSSNAIAPVFVLLFVFAFEAFGFLQEVRDTWDAAKKRASDSALGYVMPETSDKRGKERVLTNLRNMGLLHEDGTLNYTEQKDRELLQDMYEDIKNILPPDYGTYDMTDSREDPATSFWRKFVNSDINKGASGIHDKLTKTSTSPYALSANETKTRGIDTLNDDLARFKDRLGKDLEEAYRGTVSTLTGGKSEAVIKLAEEMAKDPTKPPSDYLIKSIQDGVKEKLLGGVNSAMEKALGKKTWAAAKKKYGEFKNDYEATMKTLEDMVKVSGNPELKALLDKMKKYPGQVQDEVMKAVMKALTERGLRAPKAPEKKADEPPKPPPPAGEAKKGTPAPPRTFESLTTNEVDGLLHCLCKASLGASPQVAAGYNLTIPKDADPEKHSCGSLGNGPCMAQGWGCWRSFMNLHSEEAKDCFKALGLSYDPETIRKIHSKYQQKYIKPLQVEIEIEPKEVCPGDKVTVRVRAKGGMGDYQYHYYSSDYLLRPGGHIRPLGEMTTEDSMTLTVYPNLVRDQGHVVSERVINGRQVRTRGPEAVDLPISVGVTSYDVGDGKGGRSQQVTAIGSVRLRSDADCKQAAQEPADQPPESPPVVAPPAGVSPPPALPPVVTTPDRDQTITTGGGAPSGPVTTDEVASGPDTADGDAEDYAEDDEKVDGEDEEKEEDADKPRKPGDKKRKTAPPGKSGGKSVWTGDKPEKGKTKGVTGGSEADADCYFNGGGYAEDGGPATMFFEVQPGERIRVTIQGTDGFTKTVEGVGRVEFQRPLSPNGTDTIIMENLDRPLCKEQLVRAYDENGAPKMEPDGLQSSEPDLPAVEGGADTSVAEGLVRGVEDAQAKRGQEGYRTQQIAQDLNRASTAGDAKLQDAQLVRDSGGRTAKTIGDQSARETARGERDESWGKALGDGVESGITAGLTSFGSSFGATAADRASSEIFDRDKKKEEPAAAAPAEEETKKAASPPASSKKKTSVSDGKSHPSSKGKSQTPEVKGGPVVEEPPSVPMETITCSFCGFSAQYPAAQKPTHCPQCGCGPGRDLLECVCGFKGFVPSTGGPPKCPQCGRGGAVEDTTPSVPPAISPTPASAASPAGLPPISITPAGP